MNQLWKISLCIYALLFTGQLAAAPLTIAVASNFTAAMTELTREFENISGHQLNVSYGSSGKFVAQIRHGAPFDVFLSADQDKPTVLIDSGLALPESRLTYAIGALALWSKDETLLNTGNEILLSRTFNKLAIANPRLAPYGLAAVDVLRHFNLEDSTRSSWVMGENIAQTYQYVSTGNADIGFIALSQIMTNGQLESGSAWLVPPELHRTIKQDAILLKRAGKNKAAIEFMTFLSSVKAKKIISSYSYRVN
ncbi:Molybdate-binding protein ModA [Zhongshania aliphaticivorans]|uniref:Molybdate-binding protein ModA n=2 Tax=Zhongshania aliphaticivorans TaxID=1470434 RepID=A0A5S9NXA4_9GAMM|nr:molybdate ABC transporter substrate-binding protein [Zhongshania aliphaticivorans]CAA0088872.1 Molybdate-binding protein ModA [Zhongshania aliphaticivorans]CAA0095317.1 Molybdate-binding protein ModA [Zhongshania aliphaticivorans]